MGIAAEANQDTVKPKEKTMSTPSVSLGYVILYVKDVSATLTFYEEAFGLARRFFTDDNGKAYGELETGAARLAFASLSLAKEHLRQEVVAASPNKPPLGFEIALVTPDVAVLYARAVKAGATVVSEPATKPWGQTVAYLRDKDGHLVELCTPLP
ncbi:MAG: VOC family protein [Thermoguttaceae bacterium]